MEAKHVKFLPQSITREGTHLLADRPAPITKSTLVWTPSIGLHECDIVAELALIIEEWYCTAENRGGNYIEIANPILIWSGEYAGAIPNRYSGHLMESW